MAAEWNVTAEGTGSAIRALRAMLHTLEAHAREWEAEGWPDIDAPADPAAALRSLQGDSEARRRRALELFEAGDADAAVEELRGAVAGLIHPDLLPALALTYRRASEFEAARHVMRAHLAIHPDDAARRRRLAVYDGALPPEDEEDVTAEWLDPERRPKPSPDFMMDSR
jgi:hypothetical protein